MKHIKHPNVVKLIEVLSSHSKIYLVLELVTGGELLNKVKEKSSLSEEEARFYFQQIISAVAFCEKQHIAHRDLKLENVLLDSDGRVKISDFGLSGLFKFDSTSISLMHTTCGTVNYLAPEVFGNQGYDGHLADIWSCGVILYSLLTGRLPFEDDSISRLIERIVSGKYETIPNISPQCTDFLEKILVTDPRMRISFNNIKKHPWFVVNYIEPEGEFTDIQSPCIEKDLLSEDMPRVMNAFELINYSGGMIINKLFESEPTNFASHFLSKENPEIIMQRILLAMGSINCREKSRESRFCVIYESKTAPILALKCELLELLPELYIAIFSRIVGQLQQYRRVVNNILGNLEDISVDDSSQ